MSWHFLQGQEEVYWGGQSMDGAPDALLKLLPIQEASCSPDKETVSCPDSQSGTISKHSMEGRGWAASISLPEDFHAPIFRQQERIQGMENKWELMEKAADCGRKWRESLEKCNLNLFLSKTHRILGVMDLLPSCKILPQWGMMQDGVCLDVAVSAQTISENECLLLPTPTSHNAKEGAYPAEYTRNTPTLSAQIGGKINPEWNEWRMGWPIGHTDLKPLEMAKYQRWLDSHLKP